MTTTADVVVLGAGAAGLMCSATAGYAGQRVLLLDHARQAGRKILMSGGGRCNFTNLNTTPAHYLSDNPAFCISALKRYTPQQFVELVERHAVGYEEKAAGQLFCSDSSKAIQQLLLTEADWAGVELWLNTRIEQVNLTGEGVRLGTSRGVIEAGALVVATGGLSIPTLGASGLGYDLARQFGLKVLPTRAGLVPLTLHPALKTHFAPLAGLSTLVEIRCGNRLFRDQLLITHRGLSGPAVLQISSYWQAGGPVSINWLPQANLSQLRQQRQLAPRSSFSSWLSEYLPKRLAQLLLQQLQEAGITPPQRLGDASNQQLEALLDYLQQWLLQPAGTEGYRTAEVTLGGVDTRQISSQDFSVQGLPQVRFIGEVLDVTGQLGGFNFQWAWASAVACGRSF